MVIHSPKKVSWWSQQTVTPLTTTDDMYTGTPVESSVGDPVTRKDDYIMTYTCIPLYLESLDGDQFTRKDDMYTCIPLESLDDDSFTLKDHWYTYTYIYTYMHYIHVIRR